MVNRTAVNFNTQSLLYSYTSDVRPIPINFLSILFTISYILYSFIYFVNIFTSFCKLAHNVLDIRRSSPPYRALRSKAVGWNVGERKPHKGEADCGFSNPEPPNRRRSVYRLLCDVKTCIFN